MLPTACQIAWFGLNHACAVPLKWRFTCCSFPPSGPIPLGERAQKNFGDFFFTYTWSFGKSLPSCNFPSKSFSKIIRSKKKCCLPCSRWTRWTGGRSWSRSHPWCWCRTWPCRWSRCRTRSRRWSWSVQRLHWLQWNPLPQCCSRWLETDNKGWIGLAFIRL